MSEPRPNSELRREFRTHRWVLVLMAAAFVGCAVGAALLLRSGVGTVTAWGLAALGLFFAVALVEGMTARVVLESDRLEIVSNFRKTVVPRSELGRAVSERGAPIAVEHVTGGWIRLPDAVKGPHVNTVRAWLEREGGEA